MCWVRSRLLNDTKSISHRQFCTLCIRHSSAHLPYFSPPMLNWLKDLFYCAPRLLLLPSEEQIDVSVIYDRYRRLAISKQLSPFGTRSVPLAAIQAHIFPQAGIGERTSGRRSLFGGAMSLNSFHLYWGGLVFRHENDMRIKHELYS